MILLRFIYIQVFITCSFLASSQPIDSVQCGNTTIYFQVEGSGDPVYVLSGGPGINPTYMQPICDELSKTYQTILVHQRGTGKSHVEVNKENINIDLYSQDIRAIKEKLHHQKIILLGHSWGGMLSMHYATTYPDDVDQMLLISSGGCSMNFYHYFGNNIRSRLSEEDKAFVALLDEYFNKVWDLPMSDSLRDALNWLATEEVNIMTKAYFYDKSLAATNRTSVADINFRVLETMVQSLFAADWDLAPKLKNINIPTLILQGRQDPIDLETARVIQAAIPNSKLVILEKCGHFPWIEQKEEFFGALQKFISE
ncbi:MAG TPA: alpha/beta fold hydrolase [Saprospiraceae bacterium]|nr:alpha/beta fold hydrolase [Saprospiraceae bacterium]